MVIRIHTPDLDNQTFVWATNQGCALSCAIYKPDTAKTGKLRPIGVANVFSVHYVYCQGGIRISSNSSPTVKYNIVSSSQGAVFDSNLSFSVTYNANISTGSVSGGTAEVQTIDNHSASGGISVLGTNTLYCRICSYITTGGIRSTGNATYCRVYTRVPTGGARVGRTPTGNNRAYVLARVGAATLTIQLL